MAFASKKGRLAAILAKAEPDAKDKDELTAAYKAFQESGADHAATDAPRLAIALGALGTALGVSEKKVRDYLSVYKQEDLLKLAAVAASQGTGVEETIDIDMALMDDGSYAGREQETVTLSSVHATLTKIINSELARSSSQQAIQQEDVNLDKAWDELVKKHDGDEEAAAKEYAKLAERVLGKAKEKTKESRSYQLSTSGVVELLKLLNYDREDVHEFLGYVEANLHLSSGEGRENIHGIIFDELLNNFVVANTATLVLNERSKYFKKARATQLEANVASEGPVTGDELLTPKMPKEKGENGEQGEEGEDGEEEEG